MLIVPKTLGPGAPVRHVSQLRCLPSSVTLDESWTSLSPFQSEVDNSLPEEERVVVQCLRSRWPIPAAVIVVLDLDAVGT